MTQKITSEKKQSIFQLNQLLGQVLTMTHKKLLRKKPKYFLGQFCWLIESSPCPPKLLRKKPKYFSGQFSCLIESLPWSTKITSEKTKVFFGSIQLIDRILTMSTKITLEKTEVFFRSIQLLDRILTMTHQNYFGKNQSISYIDLVTFALDLIKIFYSIYLNSLKSKHVGLYLIFKGSLEYLID